jgi:hypothetical protein
MNTRLFFILIFFQLAYLAKAQPNKYALIITIDKYPKESVLPERAYATNDTILTDVFRNKGFKVNLLSEQNATQKAIFHALEQIRNTVKSGDIVAFHFSGHGVCVKDTDGDEVDQLDEAIAPYDGRYVSKSQTVITDDKLITDDTLYVYLKKISDKIGISGHLFVTIDACHAGTSTRGGHSKYRGVLRPATEVKLERIEENYTLGPSIPSNLFAIFAAAPNENNRVYEKDGMDFGALSLALSKAINEMLPGESYFDLFDRIKREMTQTVPEQHPQTEGNGNRGIFDGQFTAKPAYYPVSRVKGDTVQIEGGVFAAIHSGSTFAFFDDAIADTASVTPLATGKVISTGAFICEVLLDQKPLNTELLWRSRAYLRHRTYDTLYLNLFIPNTLPKSTLIIASLDTIANIRINAEMSDLYLDHHADSLLLLTPNGLKVWGCPLRFVEERLGILQQKIISYMRINYLKRQDFSTGNSAFQYSFSIEPGYTQGQGEGQKLTNTYQLRRDERGQQYIKIEEAFSITVTNTSKDKPFYFTILEFSPTNSVDVLTKYKKTLKNPCDFRLEPKQTWNSWKNDQKFWVMAPPLGDEIFKIIVTEQCVDLEQALKGASRGRSHTLQPIEYILNNAGDQSRGGSAQEVISGISSNSIPVIIKK